MNENEKQFISELRALSIKHKLVISGCGCCGSPSIIPLEPESEGPNAGYVADNWCNYLEWVSYAHPKGHIKSQ